MSDALQEYKCPCCGGAVTFDSSVQKMKCPYCDTEFDIEALTAQETTNLANEDDSFSWTASEKEVLSDDEAEHIKSYICKSCGGEIICDETCSATSCPYCDNPVVVSENVSGSLKPELIIPFKLDKKAAKEGFYKHLKGKRLLPKSFKCQSHIEEIKGLYVPFWLFDADVDGAVRYSATRVSAWSDSKYNYTKTSFYSVFRGGFVNFRNVPVDGSTKMPDELSEALEPFDISNGTGFNSAYLSGYFADKYDVSAEESINRANQRIKKSTEDAFRDTVIGYAAVTTEASSVKTKDGKSRYALLPVWLLTTKWKDKLYTFAMNGQTGKFVGDLPVDRGAYWGYWAMFAAIFSAVAIAAAAYLM